MSAYRPETAILELGGDFYDAVEVADFPVTKLRFRNDRAAATVGLGSLSDEQWLRHFARFVALPDNLQWKVALRYHGHQFRVYNPEIGDGRGFLFAQLRDGAGRLMDLGTKGSGRTPYSRFGDGRLTLKGAVRELLATEMLEALGVETSKTFSIVETGEALERGDEPSPTRSAVLVRLSHGHIRIGTFQRLAALDQTDNLRKLTGYCLRHFFGEGLPGGDPGLDPGDEAKRNGGADEAGLLRVARNDGKNPAVRLLDHVAAGTGDDEAGLLPPARGRGPNDGGNPAVRLLDHVASGTAKLAASYITAGFVHGVLNSDNINVTAESFDYGPWRWTPFWDGHFTAAYFDHAGLYSFGRQPEAIHWNLLQLARALAAIADADDLNPILESFRNRFQLALRDAILARLGLLPREPGEDLRVITAIEEALAGQTMTIDRFFFDWRGGRPATVPDEFAELRALIDAYEPVPGARDHPYWSDPEPCAMHIDEVEAIWSAIDRDDDWTPLYAKIAAVRRMGEAMRDGGGR